MLHFGIREHAMAATVNGLASRSSAVRRHLLHLQRLRAAAIRLAALMELRASSSSRTTLWAMARTADPQPVEQFCRCVPSPDS
jgi:hypothetical protein